MHAERLRGSSQDDQEMLLSIESGETSDERSQLLLLFADAVHSGEGIEDARNDLTAVAGTETMIDAAGVLAAFQGLNRIVDATGTQLGVHTELTRNIRDQLDLNQFA